MKKDIIKLDHFNDIKIATRVINKEIEGLKSLKDILNEDFHKVVNLLLETKGRVIITGVGKSGLISKKFAATLASMGTPSMFIHPMEALHGDLGMITQNDAVIFLSNSGESAELIQVSEYCKRFHIHTIGICRNKSSSLVSACDVSLVLPNIEEATNLPAPTTSTTMMLAISDVIAVVLAERKGFTHSDFKVFHPGGSIGAQLTKLKELMHVGKEMPLIAEDANMTEVILEITQKRFGCVGVVNKQGILIGLITDGDLRRHLQGNYLSLNASALMTPNPTTLNEDLFAAEVLYLMSTKKITNCFVVKQKKPIGIIHIHDLLKAKVA